MHANSQKFCSEISKTVSTKVEWHKKSRKRILSLKSKNRNKETRNTIRRVRVSSGNGTISNHIREMWLALFILSCVKSQWQRNWNTAHGTVCVCVCVSQQMLPTARKTVATVRSNEQCFVIISVKTLHKDQSVSSFVRMANQQWFMLFCIPLTER
jgi:hypothetical protein